ncbi:hypothetical protein OU994_29990 [Pseudoduganella sp. SL102]|nr:hypothetical protein [Pseudoduganella sp. SL102]WBS02426.1 hypothetical protein OU994_29990 [Pseudoduganella sp. SL102]
MKMTLPMTRQVILAKKTVLGWECRLEGLTGQRWRETEETSRLRMAQ